MIRTVVDAGVTEIELDRPESRNAINSEGYIEFEAALRAAEADPTVHVVLVHGVGPHFCAGNDLKEAADMSAAQIGATPFYAFIRTLGELGKPVIAAVEGDAVGVGATMLLHMDFVVASDTARFKTPFVHLGSTAEAGSSFTLAKLVGPRTAARMLYLGDWLAASDPAARGLITEVVSAGQALGRARQISRRLADASGPAVRATKRLLLATREAALDAAFARERAELDTLLQSPATLALLRAFSDRRGAER